MIVFGGGLLMGADMARLKKYGVVIVWAWAMAWAWAWAMAWAWAWPTALSIGDHLWKLFWLD